MSVQPNEDRAQTLAIAVSQEVSAGWRVESQTATNAILAKGKRTSHGLHLFLTIITGGMWAVVWIGMAIFNKRQSMSLTVDPYGNVLRQAL